MPSKPPKIRGKGKARNSPYPLGEFPDDVVKGIGKLIVHRLAIGHADITGDDFAGIFAKAISGEHRYKPLGVSDVIWNGCSWSIKTVKSQKPFKQSKVRLITGRNSPNFSYGISDPSKDIQKTGEAILNIWNERVNQSLNEHDDLRMVVLMRNLDSLEFALFEYEASRYTPSNYVWQMNLQGNFEGRDATSREHCFTWQPHGAQFTVIKTVPASAYKFRITKNPGIIEPQHDKLPGKPDVAFTKRKKAIFAHGCFWHGHDCRSGRNTPHSNTEYWLPKLKRNKARDETRIEQLKALEWSVIVIWECEMRDYATIEKRLNDYLCV